MNQSSGFIRVVDYFQKQRWICQVDSDAAIVRAGFRGAHSEFRVAVRVDEADSLIQSVGTVPLVVPREARPKAAALCTYLSWGMRIGRFEMNPNNGEIRFHASSTYEPDGLSESVIQRVVGVTVAMLDMHFPAFVRVLYANVSPTEVALLIRSQMRNPRPKLDLPARLKLN